MDGGPNDGPLGGPEGLEIAVERDPGAVRHFDDGSGGDGEFRIGGEAQVAADPEGKGAIVPDALSLDLTRADEDRVVGVPGSGEAFDDRGRTDVEDQGEPTRVLGMHLPQHRGRTGSRVDRVVERVANADVAQRGREARRDVDRGPWIVVVGGGLAGVTDVGVAKDGVGGPGFEVDGLPIAGAWSLTDCSGATRSIFNPGP